MKMLAYLKCRDKKQSDICNGQEYIKSNWKCDNMKMSSNTCCYDEFEINWCNYEYQIVDNTYCISINVMNC